LAIQLFRAGKAYACELNAEQMPNMRAHEKRPRLKIAPYRDRSVKKIWPRFHGYEKMVNTKDGEVVLRAKNLIWAVPNIQYADPII